MRIESWQTGMIVGPTVAIAYPVASTCDKKTSGPEPVLLGFDGDRFLVVRRTHLSDFICARGEGTFVGEALDRLFWELHAAFKEGGRTEAIAVLWDLAVRNRLASVDLPDQLVLLALVS